VRLCRGAHGEAAALCLGAAPVALGEAHRVRLCARQETSGPAACAALALQNASLPVDLVMRLCTGALDAEPARCAMLAPLQPAAAVALCVGGGDAEAAVECAAAAPPRLPALARAALCSGAADATPARCAEAVPTSVPPMRAAALCARATSATPAHCAAAELSGGVVDDAVVAKCRGAVGVPTTVTVEEGGGTSDASLNDDPEAGVDARILVLDQFNRPLDGDLDVDVQVCRVPFCVLPRA